MFYQGVGRAIRDLEARYEPDCASCRTFRAKLEVLRRNLYRVLEATGMEHAHPRVLKASVAFDEMLNHYQRHRRSHSRDAAGLPPSRAEVG